MPFFLQYLIVEDGTNNICRNIGIRLSRHAAQLLRRAKTSITPGLKPVSRNVKKTSLVSN